LNQIPTIILAGSDGKPTKLPDGANSGRPLSGYKGADLEIEGQPLVVNVGRRLQASGSFGPNYIAGPARIYRQLCTESELIDTDADFGSNIVRALDVVADRHPNSPVAFITCDILPEPDVLRSMAEHYRSVSPCDVWFPVIHVSDSDSLGASSWKPTYRLVPRGGDEAWTALGGHLVIVRPETLRLEFLRQLFHHAYATRNRPLSYRKRVVAWKMLAVLLREDVTRLVRGRLPSATWRTVRSGISGVRRLGSSTMAVPELEKTLCDLLIDHDHSGEHGCRVHIPFLDELSLALDIDTEGEARSWNAG
jgi:hypothetical protein